MLQLGLESCLAVSNSIHIFESLKGILGILEWSKWKVQGHVVQAISVLFSS